MRECARVIFAWFLIIASLVGWPYTLLTLSWLAITLTAWDVLNTTHVRNEQESP